MHNKPTMLKVGKQERIEPPPPLTDVTNPRYAQQAHHVESWETREN